MHSPSDVSSDRALFADFAPIQIIVESLGRRYDADFAGETVRMIGPRRVTTAARTGGVRRKARAYKGSKAAKRASRPKRKTTRRQRWAA